MIWERAFARRQSRDTEHPANIGLRGGGRAVALLFALGVEERCAVVARLLAAHCWRVPLPFRLDGADLERAAAFRLHEVTSAGTANSLEIASILLQQMARRHVRELAKALARLQQSLVRWQQRHFAKPRAQVALATRRTSGEFGGDLHAMHDRREVVAGLQPARGTRAHHDNHLVVIQNRTHDLVAVGAADDQTGGIRTQAPSTNVAVVGHGEERWRSHRDEQPVVFVQWQRQLTLHWRRRLRLATGTCLSRSLVRVEMVQPHGLGD